MTQQLDIEDVLRVYPTERAYKAAGTSQEAAEAAAPGAATLCAWTLQILQRGPSTPEAVAKELGRDILSIRPRFTQLKAAGLIEKTAERRRSACGRSSTVWRVVPRGQGMRVAA